MDHPSHFGGPKAAPLAKMSAACGLTAPTGSGGTARRRGSVAQSRRSDHCPNRFITIARTIAREFTEQAIGHPDGEALTEAARAIWRGIEVLEGMDRRARPSAARSVRRALSAAPVPAR